MAELSNDVQLYRSADGEIALQVRTDGDTVWLTQAQIVDLLELDVSGVSRHIRNIFSDGEVDEASNLQIVQRTGPGRPVALYSLDVVLSVGYRTNSVRAIGFRRWASDVLKRYLIKGAALNDDRLQQIGQIVQILGRASDDLIAGIADVLADYLPGLTLLRDYDKGTIETSPGALPNWILTIDEARDVIQRTGQSFPADALFGNERGGTLAGIVATIYQGFAGQDLYPTVELKAANLLYLVVKDHPLSDGNKRSGAALFVTFLARNGIMLAADGHPRIANNALAAITLMIAMSDPKEKELMIALLTRMLSDER